jgi:alpha-beta hydrolase superfamily lysophospholipase
MGGASDPVEPSWSRTRGRVLSWLWAPFAEALSSRYTTYLWDMPGYGASRPGPDGRVSLDVQGQVFTELLRYWDVESPHVITRDYGGAVALRAHLLEGARAPGPNRPAGFPGHHAGRLAQHPEPLHLTGRGVGA